MGTRKKVISVVIEVLDGMDKGMIQRAVSFWERKQSEGKITREEWYNLGEVLRRAKLAVDGNTKKFGAWRDKHFPGIKPPFASCAQTVALHKSRIEKYAEKSRPAVNNPMTLLRMYQTDKMIRLKSDGTTEKIEKTEVPEVPEAGENEKGIEGLYETLRLAVNAVVKTDRMAWTETYNAKFADLTSSIANWMQGKDLESKEVDTKNPVIETPVLDKLETEKEVKQAKASK